MGCAAGDPTVTKPFTFLVQWNLWILTGLEGIIMVIATIGNLAFFVYNLRAPYSPNRMLLLHLSLTYFLFASLGCGSLWVLNLLLLGRQCSLHVEDVFKAICHFAFIFDLSVLLVGAVERAIANIKPVSKALDQKQGKYIVVFVGLVISWVATSVFVAMAKTGIITSKTFGSLCHEFMKYVSIILSIAYFLIVGLMVLNRNEVEPITEKGGKGKADGTEQRSEKDTTLLMLLLTLTSVLAYCCRFLRTYVIKPAFGKTQPDLYFVAWQWVDLIYYLHVMLYPVVFSLCEAGFRDMIKNGIMRHFGIKIKSKPIVVEKQVEFYEEVTEA